MHGALYLCDIKAENERQFGKFWQKKHMLIGHAWMFCALDFTVL